MAVHLKHANLTVRDVEGTIRFLQTAFPEFRVPGEGKSQDGSRWVHIGTAETYLELSPANAEPEKKSWKPYRGLPGVNHLAYEVDDVEALGERMKSAGYKDSTPPNAHPHRKRRYFYDSEGKPSWPDELNGVTVRGVCSFRASLPELHPINEVW